jgi:hypothetical protein
MVRRTKVITVLTLSAIMLSGCGSLTRKVEVVNKTVEVKVPLLYCPAPTEIERPELPLAVMTPEQIASDGELAKRYVAQVKTLLNYTSELEKIIAQNKENSTSYEVVRKELLEEWAAKYGTPPTTNK